VWDASFVISTAPVKPFPFGNCVEITQI